MKELVNSFLYWLLVVHKEVVKTKWNKSDRGPVGQEGKHAEHNNAVKMNKGKPSVASVTHFL